MLHIFFECIIERDRKICNIYHRFVRIKLTDKMIDHMDIESTCVHKDSEEAQLQLQMDSNATGKNPFIISNIKNERIRFKRLCHFRIQSGSSENG